MSRGWAPTSPRGARPHPTNYLIQLVEESTFVTSNTTVARLSADSPAVTR